MMMNAYQEIYLNSVQTSLGDAFDYAINTCGISGNDFVKMFVVSSVCTKMEKGEVKYLVGKSGIELVREIIYEATGKEIQLVDSKKTGRSKEYWIGWVVAYYQWYSARKYQDIFKAISFEDLKRLYMTLHEADVTKFVDVAESRIKEVFPDTNLKRIRVAYGCSQSELARDSGVSLRSIQMYEQRQKDINKANAETVYRLSKFLGCEMEDLIEH